MNCKNGCMLSRSELTHNYFMSWWIGTDIAALIDDIRMRYAHLPTGLPRAAFEQICAELHVSFADVESLLMTAHTPLFAPPIDLLGVTRFVIVRERDTQRLVCWQVSSDKWDRLAQWGSDGYWYRCDGTEERIHKLLGKTFTRQLAHIPAFNWELYHGDDE